MGGCRHCDRRCEGRLCRDCERDQRAEEAFANTDFGDCEDDEDTPDVLTDGGRSAAAVCRRDGCEEPQEFPEGPSNECPVHSLESFMESER